MNGLAGIIEDTKAMFPDFVAAYSNVVKSGKVPANELDENLKMIKMIGKKAGYSEKEFEKIVNGKLASSRQEATPDGSKKRRRSSHVLKFYAYGNKDNNKIKLYINSQNEYYYYDKQNEKFKKITPATAEIFKSSYLRKTLKSELATKLASENSLSGLDGLNEFQLNILDNKKQLDFYANKIFKEPVFIGINHDNVEIHDEEGEVIGRIDLKDGKLITGQFDMFSGKSLDSDYLPELKEFKSFVWKYKPQPEAVFKNQTKLFGLARKEGTSDGRNIIEDTKAMFPDFVSAYLNVVKSGKVPDNELNENLKMIRMIGKKAGYSDNELDEIVNGKLASSRQEATPDGSKKRRRSSHVLKFYAYGNKDNNKIKLYINSQNEYYYYDKQNEKFKKITPATAEIFKSSYLRKTLKSELATKLASENSLSGLGFAVWHGSPHSFDKFTTEKIGTGEGAQAYGWGLYFTDKKDIAEWYADRLVDITQNYSLFYKKIYLLNTNILIARYISKLILEQNEDKLTEQIADVVKQHIRTKRMPQNDFNLINDKLNKIVHSKGYNIRFFNVRSIETPKRSLYKAKIKGDKQVEELNLLDWDKPLHQKMVDSIEKQLYKEKIKWFDDGRQKNYLISIEEQIKDDYNFKNLIKAKNKLVGIEPRTDNIQEKIEKYGRDLNFISDKYYGLHYKNINNSEVDVMDFELIGGNNIYGELTDCFDSQKEASLFLLRAGIDGIKYCTGSTRNKNCDAYNYVIFDENAVEIEEHTLYGIKGMQNDSSMQNAEYKMQNDEFPMSNEDEGNSQLNGLGADVPPPDPMGIDVWSNAPSIDNDYEPPPTSDETIKAEEERQKRLKGGGNIIMQNAKLKMQNSVANSHQEGNPNERNTLHGVEQTPSSVPDFESDFESGQKNNEQIGIPENEQTGASVLPKLYNSQTIAKYNYQSKPLQLKRMRTFFGNLLDDANILIYGKYGDGKSSLLLEISEDLAMNGKVLFILAEEKIDTRLKERMTRLKIQSSNIEFLPSVDFNLIIQYIETGHYKFVIIDSKDSLLLSKTVSDEEMYQLMKRFPQVSFVYATRTDKTGKEFTGGSKYAFEVDTVISVSDGIATLEKHRDARIGVKFAIFPDKQWKVNSSNPEMNVMRR